MTGLLFSLVIIQGATAMTAGFKADNITCGLTISLAGYPAMFLSPNLYE